jgi:hypothetical protein
MSLRAVEEFTRALPYPLREQVVGYARSVRDATPEILEEARLPPRADVRERIVLIAGVRKLQAICSANFWVLDNAARIMESAGQERLQVGRTDFSRGSELYGRLSEMLSELELILRQQGISEEMLRMPYAELARVLADERTSAN